MPRSIVRLTMRSPSYGSNLDEKAFYEWLEAIDGVVSIGGSGSDIEISIDRSRMRDRLLRDLLAIYYRYDLDFDTLRPFVNARNRKSVMDPDKYWAAKFRPAATG